MKTLSLFATRQRKPAIALIALLIAFIAPSQANEPFWTREQRMEQRQAVVTGEVTKVEDLGEIGEYSRLVAAEIKIKTITKQHPELKEPTVRVYYEGSNNGAKRCPNYAALSLGMSGEFFLIRNDTLTRKQDFVIEMGSDAIVTPTSPILSPELVGGREESAKEVEAAKLRGAESAAKDIAAGNLRILGYGGPQVAKRVDEATGYRYQIIGTTCIIGDAFRAEADAYNQAMRDWHAKHPQNKEAEK